MALTIELFNTCEECFDFKFILQYDGGSKITLRLRDAELISQESYLSFPESGLIDGDNWSIMRKDDTCLVEFGNEECNLEIPYDVFWFPFLEKIEQAIQNEWIKSQIDLDEEGLNFSDDSNEASSDSDSHSSNEDDVDIEGNGDVEID